MVQKIWTVRGHIICLNHDHVTGSKEVLVDGDPIEPITRDNPAKRNWLQWLDLGGELRFHLAGESCVIAIRSTLSGFSYELSTGDQVVPEGKGDDDAFRTTTRVPSFSRLNAVVSLAAIKEGLSIQPPCASQPPIVCKQPFSRRSSLQSIESFFIGAGGSRRSSFKGVTPLLPRPTDSSDDTLDDGSHQKKFVKSATMQSLSEALHASSREVSII
eukprot:CAMPEP_0184673520 /NCGR_PEP_ID=MMETSP0308-20130426/86726_1 /TAXON_ID=38269 /ORGANISM="Gloeochaete witrockiana, Strain SAG 46.84" /LENGTH=214 /DNA_ID=CAMNT_0027121017 /DNA_START=527 /DNA_END=1171 /DNA_ORIENTATION=-